MSKEWDILHTSTMPVIALRGLTVFPNVLIHFEVSREASVRALEAAMTAGSPVFLVGQKDISVEEPELDDLYQVGTISNIRQILRMPGDNVRVMVEGQARGRLLQLLRTTPHLEAEVEEIEVPQVPARGSARTEALIRASYEMFQNYAELSPKLSPDLMIHVLASQDPGHIADYIAQNIPMRNSDKQSILEELRPARRLEKLYRLLEREVEILALDQEIQERAREQMNDHQRDYYLREQMKAIQTELGEEADEIEEYREKIARAKLPDLVREKLNKELGRLAKQSYSSSESTVLRNYLDICLELPWGRTTKEKINVSAVQKVLDQDHFGLEKVKRRVLEQLLYHLGRWLYLVDAADDLKKDAVSGNYNPVALRFGLEGGVWTVEARREFAATLDHSIHMMTTAFELWDFGVWTPVLESTLYTGLFQVGKAVLDDTFRAVRRGRIRKNHKNEEETT